MQGRQRKSQQLEEFSKIKLINYLLIKLVIETKIIIITEMIIVIVIIVIIKIMIKKLSIIKLYKKLK